MSSMGLVSHLTLHVTKKISFSQKCPKIGELWMRVHCKGLVLSIPLVFSEICGLGRKFGSCSTAAVHAKIFLSRPQISLKTSGIEHFTPLQRPLIYSSPILGHF